MMNKSKIDWCDFSWNPITGCRNDCGYCYARNQARRFCGDVRLNKASPQIQAEENGLYVLDKPFVGPSGRVIPLPVGFTPTLHRYRLPDPARKKKPANIFVVSMGDIFGPWVPDDWIQEVFKACEAAPWHNYLFLTKYPGRFQNTFLTQSLNITENMWFGFSVTNQEHLNTVAMAAKWLPQNSFISVEPLQGKIDLTRIEPTEVDANLNFLNGEQYWLMGGDKFGKRLKWVIVGAETGNRKGKITPQREWIEKIVNACSFRGVPVLLKDSKELRAVWGDDLIQEWPKELIHTEVPIPHCSECESCEEVPEGNRGIRRSCKIGNALVGAKGSRHIVGRYTRTSPPWCPKRKKEEGVS